MTDFTLCTFFDNPEYFNFFYTYNFTLFFKVCSIGGDDILSLKEQKTGARLARCVWYGLVGEARVSRAACS